MGQEIEHKFKGKEALFALLARDYPGLSPISMETAYFDDASRTLAGRQWMLRRRLENGDSLCTLKTPLPDGSRGEWEIRERDLPRALLQLVALGAPDELSTLGPLIQVCGARFLRRARLVAADGATFELALDQGVLLGGGRELPFWEVELEYKSGDLAAFRRYCEAFAHAYGLEPEPRSKFARAYALAQEE